MTPRGRGVVSPRDLQFVTTPRRPLRGSAHIHRLLVDDVSHLSARPRVLAATWGCVLRQAQISQSSYVCAALLAFHRHQCACEAIFTHRSMKISAALVQINTYRIRQSAFRHGLSGRDIIWHLNKSKDEDYRENSDAKMVFLTTSMVLGLDLVLRETWTEKNE